MGTSWVLCKHTLSHPKIPLGPSGLKHNGANPALLTQLPPPPNILSQVHLLLTGNARQKPPIRSNKCVFWEQEIETWQTLLPLQGGENYFSMISHASFFLFLRGDKSTHATITYQEKFSLDLGFYFLLFFCSHLSQLAQRARRAMPRTKKATKEMMPTSGDENKLRPLTNPTGAIVPPICKKKKK